MTRKNVEVNYTYFNKKENIRFVLSSVLHN